MALINVLDDGPVRTLEMNRPEVRNAFTVPMITELLAALRDFNDSPHLRVAVLTGAGDAFCAGGDVRGMGAQRPTPPERKHLLWDGVQRLARFVDAELDKPLLAMVNGAAVGAGLDLALMCDLRFARRDAVLSASYVRLALPPGNGAAWYLARHAGRSTALDLLWTGRRFSAEEGVSLRIVDSVWDKDELRSATLDYCHSLAAQPLEALRVIKRLVKQAETQPLASSLDAVSSHFAWLQETADHHEGTAAFAAKRNPDFNKSAEAVPGSPHNQAATQRAGGEHK
jgi:enoyl-CoA hydratase/carnithine racemase